MSSRSEAVSRHGCVQLCQDAQTGGVSACDVHQQPQSFHALIHTFTCALDALKRVHACVKQSERDVFNMLLIMRVGGGHTCCTVVLW